MPKLDILDKSKKVVGSVELADGVFGAEVNGPLMHQTVVAQLAARRRGTHNTKVRAEVSGGGKKPWKQKGTGRARSGSTRSPLWRGGAVVMGPRPRSYEQSLNKKMRQLALKSALSGVVGEGRMVVVDNLEIDAIKTKTVAGLLKSLERPFPVLVIHAGGCEKFVRGARNLPDVKTLPVEGVNVYDLLNCATVVCTRDAVAGIEKRLVK